MAANWLGLQKPVYSGRSAIRGFVEYPDKHGYQPKFHAFFGGGLRFGFLHSDENSLYWFCTFTPSAVHCKPATSIILQTDYSNLVMLGACVSHYRILI